MLLSVLFAMSLAHAEIGEEARRALVNRLTLEEKVTLVGGNEFETRPVPRLGIPSIRMTDGPIGVRNGPMTSFPSGLSLAATFNVTLARAVASMMGDETRFVGRHMLLGPGVNIARQPFGGRNFESFGEDPYLTSRLAENYVWGLNEQGVIGSVKHLAVNDQEIERETINTRVDLRALFEIHLPAFKAAIDAGVMSVMDAYNRVNGSYATESRFLNQTLLRDTWGFRGFVVSDWGATHDTLRAASGGMDLEMPTPLFFGDKLLAAVRSGKIPESVLNEKVIRLLRAMDSVDLLKPESLRPEPLGPSSPEHKFLALEIARQSLVLLKNEGSMLPLGPNVRKLAVIGPNANTPRPGGGGSSRVLPAYTLTPLEGLKERLGANTEIKYSIGAPHPDSLDPVPATFRAEYFNHPDLGGRPVFEREEKRPFLDTVEGVDPRLQPSFSTRWTTRLPIQVDGTYVFTATADDGVRVFVNDRMILNDWTGHPKKYHEARIRLKAGQSISLKVEYYNGGGAGYFNFGWIPPGKDPVREAAEVAAGADAVLIFAGISDMSEGEGVDRQTLRLPRDQESLISAVARANPNTVVILTGGGPFEMAPWLPKVKSVLQAWYAGQEGGRAIADVITGRVNPSGRLPMTFPKSWSQSPAYGNYPGRNGEVSYRESLFVGYRHFDRKRLEPEFPFGHGLSYTQFDYSEFRIEDLNDTTGAPGARLVFNLKNSGSVAGAEVVQLFVGETSPRLPRPLRELKGFLRVRLGAGETKTVEMNLDRSSFAYFDPKEMNWLVDSGEYRIEIGSSSRDLRLQKAIRLRENENDPRASHPR